ncbi:hypothetical protein ACP4OV_029854 [Aristida adscensionis]
MTTARNAACVAAAALAWALVAASLPGRGLARAPLDTRPQREFDYFALALQWPGTICAATRHCCANNGCCRSKPLETFTIHGLWPDYEDGTWPSCCRHTSFEMDKILPLKEKLDKYWPSLYCSSSSTCFSGKGPFWAHELGMQLTLVIFPCMWLHIMACAAQFLASRLIFSGKHGTCSAPVVQDELQYFSTALDLYFKYDVMEMLANGGIQISNGKEYALSDVIDAIKHAFGGLPQIVCKKGSVQELRLCFDKDLKPRDCLTTTATNENVSRKKHCPRNITLPTYDPLVFANSTGETITQFDDFEVSASLYTE